MTAAGTGDAGPRVRAVPVRARSAVALGLLAVVGVVAFGWPLLASGVTAHASSAGGLSHSTDAPWVFVLLLPVLLAVVLAELADGALDAKAVAMLGILAAAGAALRPVGGEATGFTLTFVLLMPAGRVLGRGFGAVLGATTLLASALLTGGVGPWLPFQMLAAAGIGFGAGCLPRRLHGRVEVVALALYGAVAAIAYGFAMNLWFWPFEGGLAPGLAYVPGAPLSTNLAHWLRFDLATSLGFDLPRAATHAVVMLVAGRPLLLVLRRAARRAAFGAPVGFAPADGPAPHAAAS